MAQATGETKESEEPGEGGYEIGGSNIIGNEAYVMPSKQSGRTLDRKEYTRQRDEGLDAISVGAFQYKRTEEMTYAVEEEQGAKGGEHLIRVAKAISRRDEGKNKRQGCADAEKRLVASRHLIIYEPIKEFGDEEDAKEPNGSGKALPQEVLPLESCILHQE